MKRDLYSAVAGAAATPEYREFMAFPLHAGLPDPQRALGMTRIMVFRVLDSRANWDGRRFRGLDKPLLYLSGRTTLKVLLARMGVPPVDTARNSKQLALMLLKGRGSLVIDHDTRSSGWSPCRNSAGAWKSCRRPWSRGPSTWL